MAAGPFEIEGLLREILAQIIKNGSSGGSGLTSVTTSNSGNVTFTGNGTSGSPLSASVDTSDLFKGGISTFTANDVTTVFNIATSAGFVPSFASITALTPESENTKNRTITFPDANTIRITYDSAPLTGDNITYSWIVYK